MKNVKRIAGIMLALAMICIMVLPSFAAELTGMTGSISIMDNETVKASNKLFAAYKILNLTVYGDETTGEVETFKYTVPREDKNLVDFYEEYFKLDSTNPNFDHQVVAAINQMNDEGRLYEFAEEVLKHCADMVSRTSKKNAAGNGAIFDNLALGYYVIEDITVPNETGSHRPVSAVTLDTSLPNVEIEVKAETPVVDKKIDNDNDLNTTDDRVDANEAAIGDTITYVITSQVPEMTGYDKYFFIMKDTMSKGLTYTNNMKVTLAGKELVEGEDYILTKTDNADETTELKIVFTDFIQYNTAEYVHQPIEVTYTALLNQKCEVNTIPNTNKVHLEHSHNPNVDYEGENEPTEEDLLKEPIGKTPEQKVETYTTTLEIVKTDPNGKRLEGAEFTLTGTTMNTVRIETESFELDPNGEYWKLKDGSYTTTDPESQLDNANIDKNSYASLTDKYAKTTHVDFKTQEGETLTITGTVGEDGVLRFEGIPSGEYVIEETKAPEGYNKLDETIKVTITSTYEETAGEGKMVFSYSEPAVNKDGVARVTIVNQIGSELPSTGGRGTTMFYVLGGVLVLAAVVLLVARKRMSANA